jgi:hypothetical protein
LRSILAAELSTKITPYWSKNQKVTISGNVVSEDRHFCFLIYFDSCHFVECNERIVRDCRMVVVSQTFNTIALITRNFISLDVGDVSSL